VTIEIREILLRCPTHKIPLIRIPKPIADDVVVCPECGMGGSYEEVIEKGMGLIKPFIEPGRLQELLKQAGYPGK